MPVRWRAETLGTLNLLHRAGYYGEADVPLIRRFAHLCLPVLLLIARHRKEEPMAFLSNEVCTDRYVLMHALMDREGLDSLLAVPRKSGRVPIRPDRRR